MEGLLEEDVKFILPACKAITIFCAQMKEEEHKLYFEIINIRVRHVLQGLDNQRLE